MNLRNGRFLLIREIYLTDEGAVVFVCEYWRDQADHDMRPDRPRASHSHLFKLAPGHPPLTEDNEVWPSIESVFVGHSACEGLHYTHPHTRGTADSQGWLAHPHVAALGVTPNG